MKKKNMSHIGLIHRDGRREIILHSHLIPRRDKRVAWINVGAKSAQQVADELQAAYNSIAGPFAAMEVDVDEIAKLI